jgi:PAS domain S-box-containing protein
VKGSDWKKNREGWISPDTVGLVSARQMKADGQRRPTLHRTTVSFATRMDEAATLLYPLVTARMALAVLTGFAALLTLTWQQCAIWSSGALAIETWSWFATRAQALGKPVSPSARTNFVANYISINGWWLLLAYLLWHTGTPEGLASGAVLFLAIVSICALLYYAAPVMFVLAGALPAFGATTVIAFADGHSWQQLLPLWIMLALAAIFCFGRALGMPSAQEQQRWLRETLNSYEVLADNITDIIIRVDRSGLCQYASPASLSVLGYGPNELIGTNLVKLLDAESAAAVSDVFAKLVSEKARSGVLTTRAQHCDGHWLWLQTSLKILYLDNTAIGVIGVARDITEQMAADIALRRARDDLAAARDAAIEASRTKTNFLANMSHELRTPLNAIIGFAELLSMNGFADRRAEYAQLIQGSGTHLLGLVNDLLDLSRIEAGKLELQSEIVSVERLFDECLTIVGPRARERSLKVVSNCEHPLPNVFGDKRALRQILLNLLTNAIKFTDAGGIVEAFARLEPSQEFAFGVRDNGVGIAAEDQQRVFERFGQARHDVASTEMGTGLGLPIVRGLAEAHGGRVTLESRPAHGTCVTVWLPRECIRQASDEAALRLSQTKASRVG